MRSVIRLLTVAGVGALVATAAPPALAEPAEVLRPGQLVTIAGIGSDGLEWGVSGDGGDARFARIATRMLAIDVGPDDSVYLADRLHDRLRRIGPDGVIDTVPGTWTPATAENQDDSQRLEPSAVVAAEDGSLYVGSNEAIWHVVPGAGNTLVAGGFDEPNDLALDSSGNLYATDGGANLIRKIDQNGVVSTLAGGGAADRASAEGGPATAAALNEPLRIAVDSAGNVYFTEAEAATVRKIDPNGAITTVIGQRGDGFSGDGGPAADAQLGTQTEYASGIAIDAEDNLYVSDPAGFVRRIDTRGTITSVGPSVPGIVDLAVDQDGDVIIADGIWIQMLVRNGKGKPADKPTWRAPSWASGDPGDVITLAGNGKEPPPPPEFRPTETPAALPIATGPDGVVYVSDTERQQVLAITPDGRRSVFAGTGKLGDAGDGGPATKATLTLPTGLAVGTDGSVYIATNDVIRKVDPHGTITTHATVAATYLAIDGADTLYVTAGELASTVDTTGTVRPFAGGGDLYASELEGRPATQASFGRLGPIAVDAAGTVYFTDVYRLSVYRVGVDGLVHTAIGDDELTPQGGGFAGDGGPATAASTGEVGGLATGADGALYFADTYNNRVRKVDPAGIVSTVAGTGSGEESGDGGPATDAGLAEPRGVAVTADGTVYVSTSSTDELRRIGADGAIDVVTGVGGEPATHDAGRPATETRLGDTEIAVSPAGELTMSDPTNGLRGVGTDGRITLLDEDLIGNHLAFGPDGSLYLTTNRTVERRFPDGGTVTVAGGGNLDQPVEDGMIATTATLSPDQVAIGDHGEVYFTSGYTVFQVRDDGTLTRVARVDKDPDDYGATGIEGLAVGQGGSLYVTSASRAYRIDEHGTIAVVAGTGDRYGPDGGDGGPATEANLDYPSGIAVASDGTVYIGTLDGIRRVAPDGRIDTIVPETNSGNIELTLDRDGNLYYVDDHRVRAVVSPHLITDPFAWPALVWGVVLLAVLAAAGYGILRYRRTLPGLLRRYPDLPDLNP